MKSFTRWSGAIALAMFAVAPVAAQINPSVTGLAAGDAPNGSEVIRVIQNGSTKAMTVAQLASIDNNVTNRSPKYLPRWRLALAKYRTSVSRPKIVFVADSKGVGVGAGTGSDGQFQSVGAAGRNKPTYFAQMLAERGYNVSRQSWCGSAGLASVSAINGYDPRRTLPADTAFGTSTLGGGLGQLPGASTNAITLIPDATAVTNAVDVLVYQRPTSGTASISDGTTSVAQSFAQPSDAVARISFTGFSRGAGKTYSLTRSAGGSIAPICTIAYDSTVSQIEIMNAGISGATTATWVAATNAASPLLALQAYAPDLTIIQLGTNDMAPAVNISASAYAANLSAIITAAKQSGDCILEIPTEPSAATAGFVNYGAYTAAARDVGASAGCVVVDHGARLGNWTSSSAGGFMFDGLHETANGYADEARAIADAAIM